MLLLLAADLLVFHKKAHEVRFKEAMGWSIFWIVLSLLFNAYLYTWLGKQKALEFLTGYLIEKSLSVDNLFVFLFIFSFFRIPQAYQHRILFWGIIGAIVSRTFFILAGVTLIKQFHAIIYVFGAILIYTGFKLAFQKEDHNAPPDQTWYIRLIKRYLPYVPTIEDGKFFVKQNGRWMATQVFFTLVVIEFTDIVFAIDSIPAILAITTDSFIVYTSNMCAILGLRALYFALSGTMTKFVYLKYGLAGILTFVGIKMVIVDFYKVPIAVSLGTVATMLTLSIIASLLFPPKKPLI